MSHYDDDLLEGRGFRDDSDAAQDRQRDDTLDNIQDITQHHTTQPSSFVQKPDWDNYTDNELDDILDSLTGVCPPSEIIDGLYVSNLMTAQAYLTGDIWDTYPTAPKIGWVISIIDYIEPPYVGGTDKTLITDLLPTPRSGIPENRILRLKIKDSIRINYMAWFPKICAFIHEARTTAINNSHSDTGPDGGVLVHCYRGVSRSVTAVMSYMIWALHLEPVQAFHRVSDRRPVAWPNQEFFQQLNMWYMTDCHIVDDDGNENPNYTEYYLDKQLRPAVEFDEQGRNPNAEAIIALTVADMSRPLKPRKGWY